MPFHQMNQGHIDTLDFNIMENSSTTIASKPKSKPRRSRISKAFWGLIGLMAIVSIGLISMAVVAMNKYTYATETVEKPKDPGVEIMDLGGGSSKIVSGNTLPAKPLDVDESVVDSGTSGKTADTAMAEQKQSGSALVDKVAVKPVTTPKKQQVAVAEASDDAPKSKVTVSANKPEKAAANKQHKESNKQMDNLF